MCLDEFFGRAREVPAGSKGILSIDLVRDNACTETAIVEPIVVQ